MNRREAFKFLSTLSLGLIGPFRDSAFAKDLKIEHPIKDPPEYTKKKKCDNCGMGRNNWARTRHTFRNSKGKFYTCSIHCVAALSMKHDKKPENVKVAAYLHPENMLDVDNAYYVIASAAPGTMTGTSKLAFPSMEEAYTFTTQYGGKMTGIKEVLSEADKEVRNRRPVKKHM